MRYCGIILFYLLLLGLHIQGQNKALVETRFTCACKPHSKLDSLLQVFSEAYKEEFSSSPYSGRKPLDEVFRSKADFFDLQLGIGKFKKSCCSKFSSMYATILQAGETLKLNCTVFEFSFNDPKDVSEIREAFEKHNSNHFVSETPYYYKYTIQKNNVYIISTSSTANYKFEGSLFHRFYNFMNK